MKITLENLAYVAGIASAVFVAIQAYLFKKDYKYKISISETEKAIQLSQYYKDDILDNAAYLLSVFKAIGIEDKLRSIDYKQLRDFDEDELSKLLSERDINEVRDKLKSIDAKLLRRARNCLKSSTREEYIESYMTSISEEAMEALDEIAAGISEPDKIKNIKEGALKAKLISKVKDKMYQEEFTEVVSNTLNNMEYFAMHFNNDVANEEVVYQSLHQSYLRLVKMLYFYIATQNRSGKDKYFTNIIALYMKWINRYNEKCDEEKEIKKRLIHFPKTVKK